MDLEGIMLSEISQTEKDRYQSHLYIELKQTNKPHRRKDQISGCQRQRVGGEKVDRSVGGGADFRL